LFEKIINILKNGNLKKLRQDCMIFTHGPITYMIEFGNTKYYNGIECRTLENSKNQLPTELN